MFMGVVFPVSAPSTATFAPEGKEVIFREPLPVCACRPEQSKQTASSLDAKIRNLCISKSSMIFNKNLCCTLFWQFAAKHHSKKFLKKDLCSRDNRRRSKKRLRGGAGTKRFDKRSGRWSLSGLQLRGRHVRPQAAAVALQRRRSHKPASAAYSGPTPIPSNSRESECSARHRPATRRSPAVRRMEHSGGCCASLLQR